MPSGRATRLHKGREFDTVYREGSVTSGPLFVVRHMPNNVGVSRWGFAVGKRLARKSADRNRIRRRLRECRRSLAVREGFDVVVTARGRVVEAPFGELRGEMERVLKRAGLLESGVS